MSADFGEHDPARSDGSDIGTEGRQTLRDQIRVDERRAIGFLRQIPQLHQLVPIVADQIDRERPG